VVLSDSNKKLRLAILSVHSCPVGNLGGRDTGGMNVYVREIARYLGKQGHLVDVYTRVHDPKDPQVIEIGENARLIHLKAGEVEDIHKLLVYTYLSDFVCNLENFRRSNNLQYDLLFSHYWLSGWAGKLLQCWWDIPHMMMFHTLGITKNKLMIGEDEPELRIEAEKSLAHDCHHIIVSTDTEKDSLVRYNQTCPEKISVIPCGINLELFRPLDKEKARQALSLNGDKTLLFVGRIETLKGIESLIRAMEYLKHIPDLKLLVVGGDEHSYPRIQELKGICNDLNIQEQVIFKEMVKQEMLPYYYSAADICVIPSYYESFGMVAMESLACGTPIVATRVGNMENIVREGETGYIVDDNSPENLADRISVAISTLTDGGFETESMLKTTYGYDWEIIAGKIAERCLRLVSDYVPQPV